MDGLIHNLFSISQLCDMENKVTFNSKNYFISRLNNDKVIFSGERINNVYIIDLRKIDNKKYKCLMSISYNTWTWHKGLGITNFKLLDEVCKKGTCEWLPKFKFTKDKICDACQMGKQEKSLFKLKNKVSTSKQLELIHMDLFDATRATSLGGMHYAFLLVDDYFYIYLGCFLAYKNYAFNDLKSFIKRVQKEKGFYV